MRKPLVQAIINLILPGLSYLLLKKRVTFGWLILISSIAWYATMFVEPQNSTLFVAATPLGNLLVGIGVLSAAIALSYDAYVLAKEDASSTN